MKEREREKITSLIGNEVDGLPGVVKLTSTIGAMEDVV